MASQRAKIVALGAVAALAGVGGALAVAAGDSPDGVPTTGPFTQTTDPSREDYYDQFDHAVPYLKISHAAEEAFGPRFGDVAIDRDVDPNVLRVYVVDATVEDEAVLARIADNHPQVVLQPAKFTWKELLAAKNAVSRLAQGHKASFAVWPDLVAQSVGVGSVTAFEPSLESEMQRAAGEVPVHFEVGPEHDYELELLD